MGVMAAAEGGRRWVDAAPVESCLRCPHHGIIIWLVGLRLVLLVDDEGGSARWRDDEGEGEEERGGLYSHWAAAAAAGAALATARDQKLSSPT